MSLNLLPPRVAICFVCLCLASVQYLVGADPASRIWNFSVLAHADNSSPVPITLGFVSAAQAAQPVGHLLLFRAVGPTLGEFDTTDYLSDPTITVWYAGSVLDSHGAYGEGEITAAMSTGAFPLLPNSLDAALLRTYAPGSYSVQLGSTGHHSGIVLGEIYDDSAANDNLIPTGPQLLNVSALTYVEQSNPVTVGFVIGGTQARTALIRVVGPTLGNAPWSLPSALGSPQFQIDEVGGSSPGVIGANNGWSNNSQVASVGAAVGAFPLNPGSSDAALVVSLQPGAYTISVSGGNGAAGIALTEIYLVPLP